MNFVAGTYVGASAENFFEVRFDFNHPDRDGHNILGGDVFRGTSRRFSDYLGTFYSETATIDETRQVLTCQIVFHGPKSEGGRYSGIFVAEKDRGELKCSLKLSGFDAERMLLRKAHDFLREIVCELDVVAGAVEDVALLTALHQEVKTNFASAGIRILDSADNSVVRGDAERWSESDLYNALNLTNSPRFRKNDLAWRVYLLVAPRFSRDTNHRITTGLMFDRFDANQRQGAAVFWKTKFGSPNFNRDYVRTATHELGHALNLRHTFESGKLFGPGRASTSFMNYPDEFKTQTSEGRDAYWGDFSSSFDTDELVFMRNGHLEEVIMGGDRFGTGGHDEERSQLAAQPNPGLLRLELRLSPGDRSMCFDFGDCVRIEAKLSSGVSGEITVLDSLAPCHSRTTYLVEKPNGVVQRFAPMSIRCGDQRSTVLSPERPAIYEDIQLSFGARGFTFMEPGRYRIQAIHTPNEDSRVVSNILTLWIRFPDRTTEDAVVNLFDDEIADYLALWGNPALASAERKLETFLQEANIQNHGLAQEYERCVCYAELQPIKVGFTRENSGVSFQVNESTHPTREMKSCLSLTQKYRFSSSKAKKSTLSNIAYSHLASTFAAMLMSAGRTEESALVLNAIETYHTLRNPDKSIPQTELADCYARAGCKESFSNKKNINKPKGK